ncbi:MAG: sigma 54-interacting transcriptional regulator [Candidatus Binatia bacterium]
MSEDRTPASPSSDPAVAADGAAPLARPPDAAAAPPLARIVAATAHASGEAFVDALPEVIATTLGVRHAMLAVRDPDDASSVRTVAGWSDGRALDERTWRVAGTPLADVLDASATCRVDGAAAGLADVARDAGLDRVDGLLAVPLRAHDGTTSGVLAVLHDAALPAASAAWPHVLEVVAARAVAEIERADVERRLRDAESFRGLFEEAPIAYVYEETSTRFVSANRAFMDLLGLTPEEVPQTYGLSLVAPERDTQERVHESLAAEQSGHERGAIEIELRRKDDGRPVFVQRWSRPEPDGRHTRTMIIDITARVLAERERARLQQQNTYLREEIEAGHHASEIVGTSAAIGKVLDQVRQVAATDATVLLLGETGTGKELLARAVHAASPRKARPLIKVNCAALPTGLVESELFGHERGAFTGATEKRIGRFALADGGTIFLDEIGELAPETQAKLLRVLQERTFEAVGSAKTQRVDVRVIAATNRDLQQAVADGAFRADLFYRLNVFPITVPSLAERREDVPLLVHYFVARYAAKTGRQVTSVDPRTMERLASYAWPGNIRELENVVERAVILSRGPVLEVDPEMLPGSGAASNSRAADAGAAASGAPVAAAAGRTLADKQRSHILEVLRATDWVIDGENGAAKQLGLQPSTLRGRMKKLGITRAR